MCFPLNRDILDDVVVNHTVLFKAIFFSMHNPANIRTGVIFAQPIFFCHVTVEFCACSIACAVAYIAPWSFVKSLSSFSLSSLFSPSLGVLKSLSVEYSCQSKAFAFTHASSFSQRLELTSVFLLGKLYSVGKWKSFVQHCSILFVRGSSCSGVKESWW